MLIAGNVINRYRRQGIAMGQERQSLSGSLSLTFAHARKCLRGFGFYTDYGADGIGDGYSVTKG